MQKPLTFALMGCGRIAVRHADVLAASEFGTLAAVCDVVPARAAALGERHGVPWFTDIDELIRVVTPDVVSVLTPSGLHAEHVLQLVGKAPTIVVEKPMALRLVDADRMIARCAESGTRLFVVQQNRFNKAIVKLRQALDEGRFGKMVMGTVRVRWCRPQAYYDRDAWRGTWAMDGGVLANQASHHVDMLQWMMGQPTTVFARAATRLVDIETEDTAAAVLTFAGGALGIVEATTATRPKDLEGSISILGERGTVEVSGFAMNEIRVWQFRDARPGDEAVTLAHREMPENVYGFGHRQFLKHVADCVTGGGPALIDGIEGRKSLELLCAIYESIETERVVRVTDEPRRCRLGER